MAIEVEQPAKPPPPVDHTPMAEPPRKPRLWRRVCVALLLIVGAILTPVAVLVTYAKTQILDTDRYVATVKPLAADPAVQSYIADTVTANVLSQVDVKGYVNDALADLPPRTHALAGPINNAVETAVREATLRAVQSSQFQQIWVGANRVAHKQMVKVLTGEGGAVTVERNGAVKVDLRGIAGAVKDQLDNAGVTIADRIPLDRVTGSITIFQSQDLYKARQGAKLLNTIGYALPFIVLACLGGAILLSARKRRAFVKAAIAFAIGALVLALLVNAARHLYLNALPVSVPHNAAAAIYDTLLRSLDASVRNILLVALVIAITAFTSGPARPAVAFRNASARAVAWAGADADRVGWGALSSSAWVSRNKRVLHVILAVALFVVAFRWPHPTIAVLVWLIVLALVLLAVIEFYGRPKQSPVSGGAPPAQA